jgi:hypothetical protein
MERVGLIYIHTIERRVTAKVQQFRSGVTHPVSPSVSPLSALSPHYLRTLYPLSPHLHSLTLLPCTRSLHLLTASTTHTTIPQYHTTTPHYNVPQREA